MVKKLLLLVLTLHLSFWAFSQTPGGGGGVVDCDDPIYASHPDCFATETPIDSGTGFLIAAGIAYGLKRLREKKEEVESIA